MLKRKGCLFFVKRFFFRSLKMEKFLLPGFQGNLLHDWFEKCRPEEKFLFTGEERRKFNQEPPFRGLWYLDSPP